MKYLVVGLGNIGAEYADTRHNIGFKVLDCLAEQSNIAFTTGRYGATAELRYKGRTLVLLKPSTYMNLSGKAVPLLDGSREDRAGESAGRGGRHRTPFRDASDAAERQRRRS